MLIALGLALAIGPIGTLVEHWRDRHRSPLHLDVDDWRSGLGRRVGSRMPRVLIPEATPIPWLRHGFTSSEVIAWSCGACLSARDAAILRTAGIHPGVLLDRVDGFDQPIGVLLTGGVIDPVRALELIARQEALREPAGQPPARWGSIDSS